MSKIEKLVVPDIGGAKDVSIIEILVKVGDQIAKDASVITLEGDKATMEVPSTFAGIIKKIAVKVGDKVSANSLIAEIEVEDSGSKKEEKKEEKKAEKPEPAAAKKTEVPVKKTSETPTETAPEKEGVAEGDLHAGPAVRRLAHELDLDLSRISGTGPKGRILKEDIKNYVKQGASGQAGGLSIAPQPVVDFAQFGEVETKPLSRIQKISGASLHRNWVSIPHITQFGEADITELENFRQHQKTSKGEEIKLTPIVFIMKAVVAALKEFPHFNASLDPNGEQIILKKYFHIGVAVDTPKGLVVPVIKNVDQKSLTTLGRELAEFSKKARTTGLGLTDMQGGCFSISSLGGIGGTAFTPIINAPEVAILGVSRSALKPVYQAEKKEWAPRLMLPLSLSYDHRVIDGADGARFLVYLINCLNDIRTLLL